MNDSELKQLTLVQAAQWIRRRRISPVELTEAVLDRIGRIDDRMRAFITVTGDQALKAARAAERQLMRRAQNLGPLHGVPISLKDLYDTRGIRTTAGSKIFAGRVPEKDATVVRKLKRAGAVLVGKTNLHEFAFGVTTANPHYGTARNPFNPERICGGSSGGSASAVALSLGFGSLGSDTGGSIRIPAAMCGIAGLKPTYGLTSMHGVVPLSWSLDHAGPMAQTVQDVALLLDVIAGYDRQDPRTKHFKFGGYAHALRGSVKRIKVGVPRSYFFDRVAPEVEAAVRAGLRVLEMLGARLVEVDLPSAPTQGEIFRNVVAAEAYVYHEEYLRTRGQEYGVDVRERLEFGGKVLFVDYAHAQRARDRIRNECNAIFNSAGVMITPTVPIAAPPIGDTTAVWGTETEPLGSTLTRFTRPFNLAGLPAISIPCGFTPEGLPIGMQIAGRALDELTVLRVAHTYEKATQWSARRPEI